MSNPTVPRLAAYHGGPPSPTAGANPTVPQLGYVGGPPGANPTMPNLAFGGSSPSSPSSSAGGNPTRPCLASATTVADGEAPGTDLSGSTRQDAGYSQPGGGSGGFFAMVNRLFDAKAAELAEVVLECVHSSSVDVATLPLKHKCLVLDADKQPWCVGRQQQPFFFSRLVPDEGLRSLISRSHVEFTLSDRVLSMKKLATNAVQVDGREVQTDEVAPILNESKLQFCGRDGALPILSFKILLRDGASARNNPMPLPTRRDLPIAAAAAAAEAAASTPAARYSLLCTHVVGAKAEAMLPPELWTLPLTIDGGPQVLGRTHQPGQFEKFLENPAASEFMGMISRSHLELVPVEHAPDGTECAGVFSVTNLSPNPVTISEVKLDKGGRGLLRPGQSIDFIGNNSAGQIITYLQLTLQEQVQQEEPLRGGAEVTKEKTVTKKLLQYFSETFACSGGREEKDGPGRPVQQLPLFWLELEGSAVQQSFPAKQRVLAGSPQGLVVGRLHQQSLHREAFSKEVSEYMSREHFRISCQLAPAPARFVLASLTGGNTMWRGRGGKLQPLEKGDPPLQLLHGDEILLYTGAQDGTPDGPGSLGILKWVFRELSAAHADTQADLRMGI